MQSSSATTSSPASTRTKRDFKDFLLAVVVISAGTPGKKLKWASEWMTWRCIDQMEMTKIVQAIYDMLGAGATKPTDMASERTMMEV